VSWEQKRRFPRHAVEVPAWVRWSGPDGYRFQTRCKVLEISQGGMSIQLHREIPVGTEVTFGVPRAELGGVALVRHCEPFGTGYRVGLEFVQVRCCEALDDEPATGWRIKGTTARQP